MKLKQKKKMAVLGIVCLLFSFVCSGCNEWEQADSGKITVVTTLFPYYDFVRAIAKDEVELKLILPPGQESHCFEPTAFDLIAMEEADFLIYNGGEGEQWVEHVIEMGTNKDQVRLAGVDVVTLYEEEHSENMKMSSGHAHTHHHTHEEEHADDDNISSNEKYEEKEEQEHDPFHEIEYDEHVWTSPVNAMLLVDAICEVLVERLPEKESIFRENAALYRQELEQIDAQIREIRENATNDLLIFGDRFPFLYFVKEYDFCYDAAFSGCGSDTEPSAATVAGLIELMREENISVIYHVELSSKKTAKMIAEVTDAQVLELHSCHNLTKEQLDSGVTYVDLMNKNIEALRKGFGC